MRAVARAAAGRPVWNGGAAADDVQRLPGVVSVPSPASAYLVALARRLPGARIRVLAAPGPFAAAALAGLRAAAPSLGVHLVETGEDAVLACGPLRWETDRLRPLAGTGRVLGGVAPGLPEFAGLLGRDPEGILGVVQWHAALHHPVALGPDSADLPSYVAAQAFAACVIAIHCADVAPDDPIAAAQALGTTTLFGRFALAPDGLQTGHELAVVHWRRGTLVPA